MKGSISSKYRVSGIEPVAAPPGTTVVISGSGFDDIVVDSIIIGTTVVSVVDKNNENIRIAVPRLEAGITTLKVSIENEESTFPFVLLNANWALPGSEQLSETELQKISDAGEHPTLGSFLIHSLAAFTSNPTPTVNWQGTTNASSYRIVVSLEPACGRIVQEYSNIRTTEKKLASLKDGTYYVCVTARDYNGEELNALNNGQGFTVDSAPPTAKLAKLIPAYSGTTSPDFALGKNDVYEYRFKAGLSGTSVCSEETGYSAAISAAIPVPVQYFSLPDGNINLCIIGIDIAGNHQVASKATVYEWKKDTVPPPDVLIVGTPAPQLDYNVGFRIKFPVNTSDFKKLDVWGASGSQAPACGSGELVSTLTTFSLSTVSKNLPIDSYFSFRICSYDLAGNLNSGTILENVRSAMGQTVFLTAETYQGDLLSEYKGKVPLSALDGANIRCQDSAEKGGLAGQWRALFSDASTSVLTHTLITGNVYLNSPQRTRMATSASTFFVNHPITLISRSGSGENIASIENPEIVRVGEVSTRFAQTCIFGQSKSAFYNSMVGRTSFGEDIWRSAGSMSCDTQARLYCINRPEPDVKPLDSLVASAVGNSVSLGIKFPADTSGYIGVNVYRVIGSEKDQSCGLTNADNLLVKTYDGTSTPITDEVLSFPSLGTGYTHFVVCIFSKNNMVAHRQFSNVLLIGTTMFQTVIKTSILYNATMEGNPGLSGADQRCQAHGAMINSSKWKAILSSSVESAQSRINISFPVFNSKGQLVAVSHADFFDGTISKPIGSNEYRATQSGLTWSGSTASGMPAETCGDWTLMTGTGRSANADSGTISWMSGSLFFCGTGLPLMCIDHQL